MTTSDWVVTEGTFEPARVSHFETVFTQGNGYLGTRGSFEEYYPGQEATTFVHGVFDDLPVTFTELANLPDWTELEIWLDGERFNMLEGKLLQYQRQLDLRTGLLTREVRWQSPHGKVTQLVFSRFASRATEQLCALKLEITPENYYGKLEVHSGLNGEVSNEQYKHWEWLGQQVDKHGLNLDLVTRKSKVTLTMRQVIKFEGDLETQTRLDLRNHPAEALTANLTQGNHASLTKFVSIEADPFAENVHPKLSSTTKLANMSFAQEFKRHAKLWQADWQQADVVIEGDEEAQLAMRFNIYHMLIAGPRHTERVSIGAKTLSGYGYRGHAFWDTEVFMLPFFIYTFPQIGRNLLSYRFHNLPGARRKAAANGFAGAQYPWESAATGDEVTPTWVPDPDDRTKLIRIWTGDIEIHISSDIVWAILQYWKATGDDEFMLKRGAEIILETSKFWDSRFEWNQANKRYEVTNVVGPDEFHDRIDNNAYTNYLAVWQIKQAAEVYAWLESHADPYAKELLERLKVTKKMLVGWLAKTDRVYLPSDPKSGLIEQFDGYFKLKDIRFADYPGHTESMQSILGIEGVARTQIIKQPDVVMMMALLPDLFGRKILEANYDYYTPRTDLEYGSSLGPSIQTIMAVKRGDMQNAYENFMRAARADLKDVRGNASDGIHGASAGGLWQAAVFGFGGLQFADGGAWKTEPKLPAHWTRLEFRFYWKGEQQIVDIKNAEAVK